MKIYLVIEEDCHLKEVKVTAFTNKQEAVKEAEYIADQYVIEDIEQDDGKVPEGWVYRCRLSNDGDHIRVERVELHGGDTQHMNAVLDGQCK